MSFSLLQRYRWLAGLLVVGLAQRWVPAAWAEDPEWIKLDDLPEVSVGVEAEASTERTKLSSGSSTYDFSSVTPLVGLHTTGSIYHPNLLVFDLGGDLGWGWDNSSSTGSGVGQSRNDSEKLMRYLAEFNLLSGKPYNASVLAAQDHTYSDYGSFNTYTVDATRYGGRMNWSADTLTLNGDLGYRNEDASGLTDSSQLTETYFNFMGIQQRKFGETTVTLHVNDLENNINYGNRSDTRNWSAGISDSELFGTRRQIGFGTSLSYSQSEYSGQQLDALNASENLNINHRPNLDSYLMVNFNQSELRPLTSSQVQGTVGVRHQLYESLTSVLEGHGTQQENSAATGSSTFDQYGLRLSENYTKRLQSWGRLTVGVGTGMDHQDQGQSSSGGTILTAAEPHQLYLPTSPNYRPVYLNQPKVIDSTIVVSAGSDTLVYPTDYTIVTSGELTEIKLVVPPSVHLQSLLQTNDNLAVTVTYQSESLGNSSYDTFNANVQVRLDLFNRFGIYGRVNWLDNNAPPEVLAQTLTDLIGGVDYNYQWFRTGAEGESYDSNFTRYQALRFFQNFDFALSGASSLGIDFNQSFYRYAGSRSQSEYQAMSHYNIRLPMNLNWYLEGGGLIQDAGGNEQVQGVARTGIGWKRGKLSLRVGYEFNSQSTASGGFTEDRVKHRVFTYLRRSF
jgi:hypothetical protein